MLLRTLLLALIAWLALPAHANSTWKVTLLEWDDNPALHHKRLERAYLGHPGGSAADGIRLAFEEAKFALDAAKLKLVLNIQPVRSLAQARDAALKAQASGARILLSTLPGAWTLAAVDAVKLPVINLSDGADRLREGDCRSMLFHALPSDRMRADAIAQALAQRRWQRVLLLSGSGPGDADRTLAAQSAIRRYGLKLSAHKPFKLSADPRERAQANPRLLSAGQDYDIVWVVDSDGEFARTLPYNTASARPVVGDAGWVALAWHGSFERFGAPQLVRRFIKSVKRPMTNHDWAAWIAGKTVAAAAASGAPTPAALSRALLDLQFDGSKGVALSFRPWDGQLRQPLLLTDGQGVLTTLPVDGVLHPSNALDTLGADAPQRLCKARS